MIPAPGVPQSHFSVVEITKSAGVSFKENGRMPMPCVRSTPTMLPCAWPWAISASRSQRCEAVEVTKVSSANPTSSPQAASISSSRTQHSPWRMDTVSSVYPKRPAMPFNRKCNEGKQSAATNTRLPRRCSAGKPPSTENNAVVTFSALVSDPWGASIRSLHSVTNSARAANTLGHCASSMALQTVLKSLRAVAMSSALPG